MNPLKNILRNLCEERGSEEEKVIIRCKKRQIILCIYFTSWKQATKMKIRKRLALQISISKRNSFNKFKSIYLLSQRNLALSLFYSEMKMMQKVFVLLKDSARKSKSKEKILVMSFLTQLNQRTLARSFIRFAEIVKIANFRKRSTIRRKTILQKLKAKCFERILEYSQSKFRRKVTLIEANWLRCNHLVAMCLRNWTSFIRNRRIRRTMRSFYKAFRQLSSIMDTFRQKHAILMLKSNSRMRGIQIRRGRDLINSILMRKLQYFFSVLRSNAVEAEFQKSVGHIYAKRILRRRFLAWFNLCVRRCRHHYLMKLIEFTENQLLKVKVFKEFKRVIREKSKWKRLRQQILADHVDASQDEDLQVLEEYLLSLKFPNNRVAPKS